MNKIMTFNFTSDLLRMKIVPFNERCDTRQKPVTSIDTETKHKEETVDILD